MEEDSDEKIRRNLIVASAAVLIGAWLKLPTLAITKRIFGEDAATAVAPWRLWAALIAVLVYLVLRYKFSNGARHDWETARAEFQEFRLARMTAVLVGEARRYTKTGAESRAFHGALESYVKSRVGTHSTRPEITFTKTTHRSLGKGEVEISLAWPAEGIGDSSDRPVGFELSKLQMITTYLAALLRLLGYSQSSTSLLVPVAMATTALGISIWRLGEQII